jgi:hypothetical protein
MMEKKPDNAQFGPELRVLERLKLLEELQEVVGCKVSQIGQACLLLSDLEYPSKLCDRSADPTVIQPARILFSGLSLKEIVTECQSEMPLSSRHTLG